MTEKERRDDLRASFGDTPDLFRERMKDTLAQIEEEKPVKRFTVRTAILVVLLIVLMASIALAISTNQGILGFLERDGALPESAIEPLQTEFTQDGGKLSNVTYRVRDAISDGKTLFVAIECKANNPKDAILTTMDYVPADDPEMLQLWKDMMVTRDSLPDVESISPDQTVHYVSETFATKVLQDDKEYPTDIIYGTDQRFEDLNTIVYNIMFDLQKLENPQDELTIEFVVHERNITYFQGYDILKNDPEKPVIDWEVADETTLTAVIRAGHMESRRAEAEVPFTFGDITFSYFSVETTPLATYVSMVRNRTEPENPGTMRFEIYGEDGRPYKSLMYIYHMTMYMNDETTPYEQLYASQGNLPERVVLHAIPFLEAKDTPMPDDLIVELHEVTS